MGKQKAALALSLVLVVAIAASGQTKPRARDLGIPFDGTPGAYNAITDVAGVEVGMTTLISGKGPLVVGQGPVRTGVTAVIPRGKGRLNQVFAAWFTLNGNGEMTGTTWLDESGFLEGPVLITNTHSVGVVHDAVIAWQLARMGDRFPTWSLPVVAETWDGDLNDINGFHVKPEHVYQALDGAKSGPVAEGNVGGGTGMIVHRFKGGTGTSSRKVMIGRASYTVGVLVQANYGGRDQLTIAGVPVGKEIPDLMPHGGEGDAGSIIVVIATDAPLLPHQLKRIAERASLGIGRTGGIGSNSSGDIFVAFSTANPGAAGSSDPVKVDMLPNDWINPLFTATVQATEEAIVNAMVAAETMEGINGRVVYAIPHDRLRAILKKYGRLVEPGTKEPLPAQAPGSVFLENLTWVQAEKALKEHDVVLFALGARSKEHGPHLPLKNDYVLAEYLMKRVADEVPVAVLPTVPYGYYPAFLEYPGSVSIGAETFKNFVMDICKSMHGYGRDKFYCLNTGVSTIGPLAEASKELAALGIFLRSLNVLEADGALPAGLLKQEGGTHADENETSMMLYIAPEIVDMSKAVKDYDPRPGRHGLTRDPQGKGTYSATGIYGDPTLANPEKGKVIVEATVREIVRQVRDLMALKASGIR
jgi:L-aminopeptidase/D-esterase-like protein/creatinine amidohydrolase/Fe(II)-dependent formamide hydrolase-like protein